MSLPDDDLRQILKASVTSPMAHRGTAELLDESDPDSPVVIKTEQGGVSAMMPQPVFKFLREQAADQDWRERWRARVCQQDARSRPPLPKLR